jgi:penicillin-binding protein 2
MLNREERLPAFKLTIVQYAIVAILLVLLSGLWRLQVIGAQNYRTLAEQNRIRKVPILAPRGKLFDREGRLLVDNYPSVSCFLIREPGRDLRADFPLIARGLHMTMEQLESTLTHYELTPKYQPIPLKQDITPDEVEFIESHRDELPELETIDEQRRLYPRNGFAANLIGYVGEVSDDMLNDPRYAYYEPGDVVGKSGVEQSYDALLRGQDGSQDIIVDSHGREVGILGREAAVAGQGLKLTIDLDLQRAAEAAMGERNGAIIAIDPHTGEVLALVSRPSFDPNDFSVRVSRDEWNRLITDPRHPLLDKTIQAQLAPGSTFKIIMSLAGLEDGVAKDMHVNCPGGGTFYGRYFACDMRHGMVDIQHAIPYSCDTFYYTLAERLGIEKIAYWAHKVGIGQKTGIDLPGEVSGTMPSEEWKLKTQHEKWYAGEVISVGIGQGAVAASPVQLARAIGGIASGGIFKRPHVVNPEQLPADNRQAMYESFPGSGDVNLPLDPAIWETITDGMVEALDPNMKGGGRGTAFAAHLDNIDFAGKTGTAQVVNHSAGVMKLSAVVAERPNSWFVGMVPRRNPDIVIAVLWEHGGWGSVSAPIAARVIEAFVDKQRRLNNNLQEAKAPAKVDVGAVWSQQPEQGAGAPAKAATAVANDPGPRVQGGHFYLPPATPARRPAAGARSAASQVAATSPLAPVQR